MMQAPSLSLSIRIAKLIGKSLGIMENGGENQCDKRKADHRSGTDINLQN